MKKLLLLLLLQLCCSVSFSQDGYSALSYIENKSDAYINTGYTHKTTTRVEMECEISSNTGGANAVLFGGRTAAGNADNFTFFANQEFQNSFAGTFDFGPYNPNRKMGAAAGNVPTGEKVRITVSKDDGVKIYKEGSSTPDGTIDAITGTAGDGTKPLYIFDLNDNNSKKGWLSHMKLYSFKIYEGDFLVHNYVPKLRRQNGQKVAGLYDTETDAFLTSANATAFNYPEPPLAVVSTEPVRFIESANASAAPYINTGYCPTASTKVKMTYSVNNVGSGNRILFGTVTHSTPLTNAFTLWQYLNNDNPFDFGTGNAARAYARALAPWGEILYFENDIDDLTATIMTGAETSYTMSERMGDLNDYKTDFQNSAPIYIFARNTGGTASVFGYMKLFSFQIYEDGQLVRDYVPVAATMSDGTTVGALKDLVSGEVLTSANSNPLAYSTDDENTFTLSLTNGFCTFSDVRPYNIVTEGVKAYEAKKVSDNLVNLTEIGNNIPANTGVVLYGEGAQQVELTVRESDGNQATAENIMRPNVTARQLAQTSDDGTNYLLALSDQDPTECVFRPTSGEGTLSARKAYLVLPQNADAKYYIGFADDATGISSASLMNNEERSASGVYDLQGRKMDNASSLKKGVYIINGKKVVLN